MLSCQWCSSLMHGWIIKSFGVKFCLHIKLYRAKEACPYLKDQGTSNLNVYMYASVSGRLYISYTWKKFKRKSTHVFGISTRSVTWKNHTCQTNFRVAIHSTCWHAPIQTMRQIKETCPFLKMHHPSVCTPLKGNIDYTYFTHTKKVQIKTYNSCHSGAIVTVLWYVMIILMFSSCYSNTNLQWKVTLSVLLDQYENKKEKIEHKQNIKNIKNTRVDNAIIFLH